MKRTWDINCWLGWNWRSMAVGVIWNKVDGLVVVGFYLLFINLTIDFYYNLPPAE